MKSPFPFIIASAALVGCVRQETPPQEVLRKEAPRQAESLDTLATKLRIVFGQGDANSDGHLDLNEFKKLYTPKGGTLIDPSFVEIMFREYDANEDDVLDVNEYVEGALKRPKCMDVNNDGFLSEDEIRSGFRRCP